MFIHLDGMFVNKGPDDDVVETFPNSRPTISHSLRSSPKWVTAVTLVDLNIPLSHCAIRHNNT